MAFPLPALLNCGLRLRKIMIISSSEQGTKILLIHVANLAFINIWEFFPWSMPLGHVILFAATIWRLEEGVLCLG